MTTAAPLEPIVRWQIRDVTSDRDLTPEEAHALILALYSGAADPSRYVAITEVCT